MSVRRRRARLVLRISTTPQYRRTTKSAQAKRRAQLVPVKSSS